jgi:hypothetical protein
MSIWDGVKLPPELPGHKVKRSGAVIYVCAEGQSGLENRLCALKQEYKVSLENVPLYTNHSPLSLLGDGAAEAVIETVRELVGIAGDVRLIVIDTWSRNLGGDDSSPQDSALGVQVIDTVRAEVPGVSILLVHHTGLSAKERARGWGGLRGACDMEFRLEKAAPDTVLLTCTKSKEDREPAPEAYRAKTINLGIIDEDGEPVTSLVLKRCEVPEPPAAVSVNAPKPDKAKARQEEERQKLRKFFESLPPEGVIQERLLEGIARALPCCEKTAKTRVKDYTAWGWLSPATVEGQGKKRTTYTVTDLFKTGEG